MLPAVIFGGESKLSPLGVFMDLYQAFRDRLEGASRLTTIGYSFRDEHVNAQIAVFLNRRERVLQVVDPTPPTDKRFLADLIATVGDRVHIIPERAAEALPKAFGRS